MGGQTDRQIGGQTDGRMDRHTHIDGRAGWQAGSEANRQKNISLKIDSERERESEIPREDKVYHWKQSLEVKFLKSFKIFEKN